MLCSIIFLTLAGFGRCYVYRRYGTFKKSYPNMTYDRIQPAPRDEYNNVTEPYELLDGDGICRSALSPSLLSLCLCAPVFVCACVCVCVCLCIC